MSRYAKVVTIDVEGRGARSSATRTTRSDRLCNLAINIVLWLHLRNGARAIKTTIDVPDDLYRLAKAEAALRGRKLKDLVAEGLRLALEAPHVPTNSPPDLARLMKRARGVVDSGISDLATNAEHLAGFGRNARHR